MWVVATYQATSLFSLKPATATASGGRTLLVPTPYAVKMALLDVACRLIGQPQAAAEWDAWLGTSQVALRPAGQVVVNNTFIRVLREKRLSAKKGSEAREKEIAEARVNGNYPMNRTIAYREYAYLEGDFGIALSVESEAQAALVRRWFAHINYLGKRGSFVQLQYVPNVLDDLSNEFIVIGQPLENGFALDMLLTQLDDTGDKADFNTVNIYNSKHISLGKQRILHHVALPYERVRSSRSYTYYRRKEND